VATKGGTPAIVALEAAGVMFTVQTFEVHDDRNYGKAAAAALGVEEERVFKTLLAEVDGKPAVGIVPVSGQLSLKGLAAALGGKKAEMMDPVVAQRLTGYVVGGISPFGQKRLLPTVIDETCVLFDTVLVSAGKRGMDLEVAPDDLVSVLEAIVAPISA
jgi:Cys-tRNA(Pro)/Cys-tRNA(Cys) deacylase